MKMRRALIIIIIFSFIIGIILIFSSQKNNARLDPTYFEPVFEEFSQFDTPAYDGAPIVMPSKLPILTNFEITDQSRNIGPHIDDYCGTIEYEKQSAWYGDTVYGYGTTCDWDHADGIIQIYQVGSTTLDDVQVFDDIDADYIAESFLERIGLNNLQKSDESSHYMICLDDSDEEDCTQAPQMRMATTATLTYNYQYLGIPILFHEKVWTPAYFTLNAGFGISYALLDLHTFTYTPQDIQYSTISIEQALKNIGRGNAYLLNYDDTDYNNPDFPDIASLSYIRLHQVSLEYRLDSAEQIAVPSYHFIGTANDHNDQPIDVEIITPVISFNVVR